MNRIKLRLRKILDIEFKGNHSEMARTLNVSHTSINNYIEHNRPPNYKFIMNMIDILGVSPNWLLLGIGDIYLKKTDDKSNNYYNLGIGKNNHQIIYNNEYYHNAQQLDFLLEKNSSLERENQLLREMNELLKQSKNTTQN